MICTEVLEKKKVINRSIKLRIGTYNLPDWGKMRRSTFQKFIKSKLNFPAINFFSFHSPLKFYY